MTRLLPRRLLGPTLSLVLGLASGCVPVFSVYPLYTEKDEVREPALMGAWGRDTFSPPEWIFSPGEGPEYRVGLRGDEDSVVVDSAFVGRLVRLRGVLLLDLYAGSWNPDSSVLACVSREYALLLMAPVHVIFRVDCTDSSLTLSHLSDTWFDHYIDAFPRAAHYLKGGPLLTGTTDEIRAFLSRHLEEEKMFETYGSYVRVASAPAVPSGD